MTGGDASAFHLIGAGTSDLELTPSMVGGKAANLVRLVRLGLDVPPALALPTAFSREYLARGALPADFRARLGTAVRQLERTTGLTLGGHQPLLVSVRSSPPSSMPGMLGTILNVGLTEQTIGGLIRRTGDPWLAWDAYRRLVHAFAVRMGRSAEALLAAATVERLRLHGVDTLQELDALAMRDLTRAGTAHLIAHAENLLPRDPLMQIESAVEAVLESWNAPPAREYRRLNAIDDQTGTGILIQVMVFGNNGPRSGSGVGFTRHPATGDAQLYVDFVVNAQGEDVVSGRLPLADTGLLPEVLPGVWDQLNAAREPLEREFGDMQDFEFTVDEGHLYFLQTRTGKRTPWAALRIAADLVAEGILEPAVALQRLAPYDLSRIARVVVRPAADEQPIAYATPASIGVAAGAVTFDAQRAERLARNGPVVLVRSELTTEDVRGLAAAAGVLTSYGGRTSHAAVVARQLGKVCLVGCSQLRVAPNLEECWIGGLHVREGDVITLDGETGAIFNGRVAVASEHPTRELEMVARWREQVARRQHALP